MSKQPENGKQMAETSDSASISCQQAVERVYEYLDGELDALATEQVREHIEMCRKCYPYFNFERIFVDHLRSRALKVSCSQELEDRILQILRDVD